MDADKIESISVKTDRTTNGLKTIYIGNCWVLGEKVLRNFKAAKIMKIPIFPPLRINHH